MSESVDWLDDSLALVGQDLEAVTFAPGMALYTEGDTSDSFTLLLTGQAEVRRDDHLIAIVDGPAVVGELHLFTGRPRASEVRARTQITALRGTHPQFREMLTLGSVRRYLLALAANRVVEGMDGVRFETSSGFVGVLRPLLRGDEAEYRRAVHALSPESRRRRFFSSSLPPDAVLTSMTKLDWINHFAWVAIEEGPSGPHGIGVARFIRDRHDATVANVAFGISDDYQGRGIGRVLFAALSVPAELLGITTFTAEILAENSAVRALLAAAEPVWTRDEPGVLSGRMAVSTLRATVDIGFAAALGAAVDDIARIFDAGTDADAGAGAGAGAGPDADPVPDPAPDPITGGKP